MTERADGGGGCLAVFLSVACALLIAWVAWGLVLSPVWDQVGGSFTWPVVLLLAVALVAVSSMIGTRLARLGAGPPPPPPDADRGGTSGPEATASEVDEGPGPAGASVSGASPAAGLGDVARTGASTCLVLAGIALVSGCAVLYLMSNAMTGHLR